MNTFICKCKRCGRTTSRAYSKQHGGNCKACVEPEKLEVSREARIIDSGYQAYTREEGHYDTGDY